MSQFDKCFMAARAFFQYAFEYALFTQSISFILCLCPCVYVGECIFCGFHLSNRLMMLLLRTTKEWNVYVQGKQKQCIRAVYSSVPLTICVYAVCDSHFFFLNSLQWHIYTTANKFTVSCCIYIFRKMQKNFFPRQTELKQKEGIGKEMLFWFLFPIELCSKCYMLTQRFRVCVL